MNPGPLKKQTVLLTAETSLQPSDDFLMFMIVLILILVLNNEEAENIVLPLCPADHIVVSLSYSKYTINWRLIDFNMCSQQV